MVTGIDADYAATREGMIRLTTLAQDYHRDPEIRKQLHDDPRGFLAERDYHFPASVDLRFATNSSGVFHVVFPPDPNVLLDDEALSFVAGGKTASSVGSASTYGTASSIPSTFGTLGSAGSAGTAGSAG